MLALTFKVEGLEKVRRQLDATGEVLKDFEPEMAFIGEFVVDFFSNAVFETEGNIIGESWAPLSEQYHEWKLKNYPGRGILERTSKLRKSFHALPASDYCIIYNDAGYGGALQSGTDKMPPRVFMKIDDERGTIIRDMIIESLNDRVQEAMK